MPRVYVGVGSNIDPEVNILRALRMLVEAAAVVAVSTFYRTRALGPRRSPDFVNGVIAIETEIEPREFKFELLRGIEKVIGRLRGADKYEPRTIDLDIELYGDIVLNEPDLTIPDPEITERTFIAVPLLELDPALVLPGSNEKLCDVVRSLGNEPMIRLDEFTDELRRVHLRL